MFLELRADPDFCKKEKEVIHINVAICSAMMSQTLNAPIFPPVIKQVSEKTWRIFMFADANWFLRLVAITTGSTAILRLK
jgi:hypothetical protein